MVASTIIVGWRLWLTRLFSGIAVLGLAAAIVYCLARVMTGTVGGAVAGGVVALLSVLVTKWFEFQKQHGAPIAEKKRDVYRRLLSPWETILVAIRANKPNAELLSVVDFASWYGSVFDTGVD